MYDISRLRFNFAKYSLAFCCFAAMLWLTGCNTLPADIQRPVSTALSSNELATTRLGAEIARRASAANTKNDSAFALVGSAELAFTSRMTLIDAAQKTLDLQYYAIHADETTERLFEAIKEAASRGVRVRVLLDDFNTAGKNAQVLKLGFEKDIELRLFNPLPSNRASALWRIVSSLGDVTRLQRRMHNKILVADNAVGITGGRNLGDTYFGQSEGVNFVDIDVLTAGRITRDMSRSFDKYWNNPLAYPVQSLMTEEEIEAIKPKPAPDAQGLVSSAEAAISTAAATTTLPALPDSANLALLTWTWAASVMLVDEPSKIAADADSVEESNDSAVDGLLSLMSRAQTDLLIVTPYFVPGELMMQQFADIKKRGVRVRVLTNSLASNDAVAAHAGYARYREALLGLGIELYEMRSEQRGTLASFGSGTGSAGRSGGESRASLHAKAVVIDNQLLVVGSMNLDLRSKLQNSEVAVVLRSRKLAKEATALIEPSLINGAYRVENQSGGLIWRAPKGSGLQDTTSEPDASLGLKILVRMIGPFAPDEML
jgi:cardiolipin synthase C